jgi:hypothetical protein
MKRSVEKLIGRGIFHDLAQVHHGNDVADIADHVEIMGDEEITETQPFLKVFEEVQDLCLNGDIQGRDRLIADKQGWADTEGPGDSDSLPLSATELMRITLSCRRGDSHHHHQIGHPVLAFATSPDTYGPQSLFNALPHGHAGVERAIRILENDLHLLPKRLHFRRAEATDVIAAIDDLSLVRLEKFKDQSAYGGFSAPALPHEAQGLPRLDLEIYAVHGLDPPCGSLKETSPNREVFPQSLDFEDCIS